MDRFGTRGVRMAWYDPEKADEDVLQGYTKVRSSVRSFFIKRFFLQPKMVSVKRKSIQVLF